MLITWQVVDDGPLLRLDRALRDASSEWARGGGAAQLLADLGGAPVALPVLALGAMMVARRRRSWAPLVLAAIAAACVPLLVLPLKSAVGRTGPDGAPLGDYAGYFPSGHAATAAVVYGSLALLLHGGARRAPYVAVVLLNLGVGAGLVLRGYHWATDVVASWALAVLVLCALMAGARGLGSRRESAPPASPPRAPPPPSAPGR